MTFAFIPSNKVISNKKTLTKYCRKDEQKKIESLLKLKKVKVQLECHKEKLEKFLN